MTWQIPLFFNIIFATIRGFLDKKLADRLDPFVAFLYVAFWSGLLFGLFYIFRHGGIPPLYPQMMLLGVLYSFAIGSYMGAVKINLSQSVIFGSYYLLIPMFLSAIFLGEWKLFDPTTLTGLKTITGVAMALVSMFLILQIHSKKEAKIEMRWIYFISINIILNGIGTYLGKAFVNTHGPLETVFSQAVAGVPTLILINLVRKKKISISLPDNLLAITNGVIVALAVTFYYAAVKVGPLSIILPIQTLVLTVTITLIGLFIYKEAHFFTREKLVGLLAGIVGVVLLML